MSEFSWINKQGVVSDQGFSVQRTSRFTAEYREGIRKIEIEVEPGLAGGKSCIYYTRSSFDKLGIDKEEQSRVINNFRRALIFKGLLPIEG